MVPESDPTAVIEGRADRIRWVRRGCIAVLWGALVATALLAVVVETPLQEVSFRWIGLAGVALPTAVVVGLASLAAGLVWTWVRDPDAGRRRSPVLVAGAALVPWMLVVWLAAPTLRGLLAAEEPGDGAPLSVLAQNLWYEHPEPDRAARALLRVDADVLVLIEYTPAHAAALRAAGLEDRYPYRWEEPGDLGGGLAVASQVPILASERISTWSGAVRVTLDTGGGPVDLVAVHPIAPSDKWGLRRWRTDYRTLTAHLSGVGPATIVAGDFNAVGAHRRFRKLMTVGELRDAADVSGSGFGPTWPGTGWVPAVMRLDHVLVGDALGVEDHRVLPDIGADHRGVLTRLRVDGG